MFVQDGHQLLGKNDPVTVGCTDPGIGPSAQPVVGSVRPPSNDQTKLPSGTQLIEQPVTWGGQYIK